MNPLSLLLTIAGALLGRAIAEAIGRADAGEPLAVDGKVVDQVEAPPATPAAPATSPATGGAA